MRLECLSSPQDLISIWFSCITFFFQIWITCWWLKIGGILCLYSGQEILCQGISNKSKKHMYSQHEINPCHKKKIGRQYGAFYVPHSDNMWERGKCLQSKCMKIRGRFCICVYLACVYSTCRGCVLLYSILKMI